MELSKKNIILNTFQELIDTIKSHDNSIYFWIQGGAIRRAIDENKKSTTDWMWPVDIDIHCRDSINYEKIKNILIQHMDFKMIDGIGHNLFLENSNTRIDLQDGGLMSEEDFFFLNKGCLWADYTISSVTLDSNYNLCYHKDFFNDVKSKKLRFVKRDYDYINTLIEKASNQNLNTFKKLKLFFSVIFINCLYTDDFDDSEYKPRYHKHINDGYSMSKDDYASNGILIKEIKDSVSDYLKSYEENRWWQNSQWYGIIQKDYGEKLRDELLTESDFKVVEDIIDKIHESDNTIKEINLKDSDDNI